MWLKPFTIFKPTYPAGINQGHPLAENLVFFCLFNTPFPTDLVTGTPGVPSGSPVLTQKYNGASSKLVSASSQYYEFAHSPIWNVLEANTILWRGWADTGSFHFMGKHAGNGASNNPFDFRRDIVRANAGGFRAYTGPTVSTADVRTIAYVNPRLIETAPTLYHNGAISTAAASSGSGTGAPTGNTSNLRVGRRVDNGTQMDGGVVHTALWSRPLTIGELVAFDEHPYEILRPSAWRSRIKLPANSYTLAADTGAFTLTGVATGLTVARTIAADTGAFTLTGQDAGLTAARTIGAETGSFTITGVDVGLEYSSTTPSAGGLPRRKKRRARDATEGNRDFLGSRRNSRPGIAEEEMREVMATVRTKAVSIPLDAIEDDDEEAILWLL